MAPMFAIWQEILYPEVGTKSRAPSSFISWKVNLAEETQQQPRQLKQVRKKRIELYVLFNGYFLSTFNSLYFMNQTYIK